LGLPTKTARGAIGSENTFSQKGHWKIYQ